MNLKSLLLILSTFGLFILFSCTKEESFETGQTPTTDTGVVSGTAKYSFDGGSGACTGAIISGTFTAGTATNSTNAVVLKLTVDSIGTYIISTATVNGVSFSGSGSFTSTGQQNITLTASGTPITSGNFNYKPGSSGCVFSVTVNAAPSNTSGNFKAKIDGTQWVADKYAQGARIGGLINLTGLGFDKKTITMTLKDSGVHQYTLAWDNSSSSAGAFTDSALSDFTAFTSNAGDKPEEGGGVVNITSIDEVNKTMTGTFSFKAKRSTDNSYRTISEGVFTNLPYITSLPPTSSNDTLTVKIDGTSFAPVSINGIYVSMLSSIAINGTDGAASKTIGLNFPSDITVGTYSIGSILDPYYGQYNPNSSTFLSSSSGTLEILFHDPASKRIRGKFSFDASQFGGGGATAKITEGYFAVTYL